MTIWKFPLNVEAGETQIIAPQGAKVIRVGLDPQGLPCVWVECDPETEYGKRDLRFYVIGTGNSIPDGARRHVGSFVLGLFVWHVYTRA